MALYRLRVFFVNQGVHVSFFNTHEQLLAAIRGFSSNPNVLRLETE